jgi:ribonuclease Z
MNLRIFAVLLALSVVSVGIAASCMIWRAAEIGELVGPLEERGYPRLTVVTVGTGGGYENPERGGPCTAVGWGHRVFLVDAGRGVAEGLRLSKIPVSQPGTVLLTNLMPANTQGLDDLIFTGWLAPRERPLRVIGPTGSRSFVEGLLAAYRGGSDALGDSLGLPSEGARVEILEIEGGWSEVQDNLTISAGALPGGPLPALAYRFEGLHRSVVVAGTGWAPDALVEFAQDADILVHEAVYIPLPEEIESAGVIADPERLRLEAALHTSLLDVGELASRAHVRTLLLVRMRPPPFFDLQIESIVDDHFNGRILLPEDGDEISP